MNEAHKIARDAIEHTETALQQVNRSLAQTDSAIAAAESALAIADKAMEGREILVEALKAIEIGYYCDPCDELDDPLNQRPNCDCKVQIAHDALARAGQ